MVVAETGELGVNGGVDVPEGRPKELEGHRCAGLPEHPLGPEHLPPDLGRGQRGQVGMAPGVVEDEVAFASLELSELRVGGDAHPDVEELVRAGTCVLRRRVRSGPMGLGS